MTDFIWYKIIDDLIKKGEPLFQEEIKEKLGGDKAIVSGYLRCLVDLEKIKCKKQGNSVVYYKEVNKK